MTKAATVDEQYNALRSGCGIFDLAGWSSISITGGDRQAFLHNFCTNDVKGLASSASCEAFILNAKGRILGHGVVIGHDDELVFFGAPGQAPRLVEHMDRYIIREDVQLRDTTEERGYLLVSGGARARECFERAVLGDRLAAGLRRVAWRIVASEFAGVLELASGESQAVIDALVAQGCLVGAAEAFTALRIEAGFPLVGVDFDERDFPQEVGRDREAISFTKGCYLGQETVARIDALGHVNQRLVGVRFGGEVPAVGSELSHAGKPAGRVTSAAFSPRLGAPMALAMVRREHNAAGERLESPAGEGEIVALPL